MIKLGNKDIVPKELYKVMRGIDVVWEKSRTKTLSFNLLSDVSPFATFIPLSENIYSNLKGKKIIEITIAGTDSFIVEKLYVSDNYEGIFLGKSLDNFINVTGFIKRGTKITIKYE